jgi:2-C-methyl-D-erythritol 2,4-cyclodiphosphate synthase
MGPRIGFGYDVHRLAEGIDLRIGGVTIPFPKGAAGHSDADVLIHAICDALLGAAGLEDIGHQFPDTSTEFKGIDSTKLLTRVVKMVADEGYEIGNIDTTLCLEHPKVSPFIPSMKAELCPILGIDGSALSIKATTGEGLGAVGRGEGIEAYAVALIQKISR